MPNPLKINHVSKNSEMNYGDCQCFSVPKWMHPISATFPIITATMDRPVVFAACEQSRPCSAPGPSTNTLQQPPAPGCFLPPCFPAAFSHREHGHISSFLSATLECLGVVYGDARQRQFPCYQTVPISKGSSTQLFAAKAVAKLLTMPLCPSSRKIFSPGFPDFLYFKVFLSGQRILQYTARWVQSDLWLYFFWSNLMAMQRPQRLPGRVQVKDVLKSHLPGPCQ